MRAYSILLIATMLIIANTSVFCDEENPLYWGEMRLDVSANVKKLSFTAIGTVWGAGASGFPITDNYNNSSTEIYNHLYADNCDDAGSGNVIGYGLYKVTVTTEEDIDYNIYIDWRDCEYYPIAVKYVSGADINVYFDVAQLKFKVNDSDVSLESITNIWDLAIKETNRYNQNLNGFQPTNPDSLRIVNSTGAPQLQWNASVPSVAKYHVYRNSVKITNNALTTTSYTDNGAYISVNGEATYYKVQAVSGDETKTSPGYSNEVMCHTFGQGEEDMRGQKPVTRQFKQNIDDIYPNPFNPETMIRYSVAEEQNVNITVFDAAGKQIKVLLDAVKPKGEYEIRFNASHLSSGVYYCRMSSGRHSETKKIILQK